MKSRVIIGYSTNRDSDFVKRYNKSILKSTGLSQKKDQVDILPLFNDGRWSLTQAYNKLLDCVEETKEDVILVLIHHDVKFKSQGWGKNLLNIFNSHDVDILGLAGTDHLLPHCAWWLDNQNKMSQTNLWGTVWHTDGKKEWATKFSGQRKCQKVQPVAAIDGVFMAIDPATCLDFDEEFGGFHLYDISFCIENHLHGKKIAVTETIQLLHDSGGQLSIEWEQNRSKLSTIYQNDLPIII